jgi:hypothetical protein
MGVNDAKRSDKESRKNAAFEKRKKGGRTPAGGNVADWAGVDPEQLRRTVASVCVTGDAIRLGYTRDGGAYAVALLHNGESATDYISPNDDIDAYLKGVEDDYRED